MIDLSKQSVWFITGSQHLYGEATLKQVAADAQAIVGGLGLSRKVVAGHWQDPEAQARIGAWARAACAWHDAQSLKVARFGDNMRQVAVTEGDKVEAQRRFGYAVNGYGVGDLARPMAEVGEADISRLLAEYDQRYAVAETLRPGGSQRESLW